MNNVHLETALLALKLGLSPVPPKRGWKQGPDWSNGRNSRPLRQPGDHPAAGTPDGRTGNGLACGVGGLDCFEFDHLGTFNAFLEAAWALDLGELVDGIGPATRRRPPAVEFTGFTV